jgi:NAD(P)-dependent dehydrogenase (short-subunit alcohol dehydrogenase family)
VADLDPSAAEAVASEVSASGGRAAAVEVDISDERSVGAMYETIRREVGRVDVLCNAAADIDTATTGDSAPFHEVGADVWRRMLDVNVIGTATVTRGALPFMLEARHGAIVNIVSIGGLQGDLVRSAYNASKAALVQLTRDIATQYGKNGIRCNAIAPGFIITRKAESMLSTEAQDFLCSHVLTERLGLPADIANAVAFLASDDSGFITGALLVVDGGMTVHAPTFASSPHI